MVATVALFLLLQAAQEHPYVVKPSAGRMGSWVACGALAAVVGFCCINPDGGDYGVWIPQVSGRAVTLHCLVLSANCGIRSA
jgi:hypothetical protein